MDQFIKQAYQHFFLHDSIQQLLIITTIGARIARHWGRHISPTGAFEASLQHMSTQHVAFSMWENPEQLIQTGFDRIGHHRTGSDHVYIIYSWAVSYTHLDVYKRQDGAQLL